jgi:hypothetical protein
LTTLDSNLTSANFTTLSGMTVVCSGGGAGANGTGGAGGTGAGNGSASGSGTNATSFGSGGGGGAFYLSNGGNGKDGVVVIRYLVV